MTTIDVDTVAQANGCPRLRDGISFQPFQTGTTEQLYLVVMPDGRRLQISSTLYQMFQMMDGQNSWSDIATRLAGKNNGSVNGSNLRQLIEEKYAPAGFLEGIAVDPKQLALSRPTELSPLQLLVKVPLFTYDQIAWIAWPLSHLFNPIVAKCLLTVAGLVLVSLYIQNLEALREFKLMALTTDLSMLATVIALIMVSSVFHEFGHLSACRRYGCRHGPLGLGLYYTSFVFYVDVTDAWRLPRWERVVVDLGGLYFQIQVATLYGILYLVTYRIELLLASLGIILTLASNLNPMLKYDGYWALSDAVGLPNLHLRVADYFGQLLGGKHYAHNQLFLQVNRTAHWILAAYALSFAVYFGVFLAVMFSYAPQFVVTYPSVASEALTLIQQGWTSGQPLDILDGLWQLLGPTFFIAIIVVLLRRLVVSVWRLEPVVQAAFARYRDLRSR